MEDILRFDGDLNLAQGNIPAEDYDDARNIAIAEDDQGNAGAVKKLRSITEEYSIEETILATTIDNDNNQYFIQEGITYTRELLTLSSNLNFEIGGFVSQSNGSFGITVAKGLSTIEVIKLSSTNFFTLQNLYPSRDASGSGEVVTDRTVINSLTNAISLTKIDPAGNQTYLCSYNPTSSPTIPDPTLKIIGNTLVWNYYKDGVPLAFENSRIYGVFDEVNPILSDTIDNIFLINRPPDNLSIAENTSVDSNTFFDENSVTFAARYVFDSGEVSALSSYNTFIATPDRSDENFGVNGVESIEITVSPTTGYHPKYASKIQFYGRVGIGSFRRIETIDITNQSSNVSVTFTGQLSESLSTDDTTRLFDSVPLKAEALETIQNRLFLGNIVDDLPNEFSDVSITLIGDSSADFSAATEPSNIDKPNSYLITSTSIVNDKVTGTPVSGQYIENRNTLTNESTYKLIVCYYDDFLRTRGGVKGSIASFSTGLFAFPTRIKQLTVSATSAPSWAKYYKVFATRNLSKDFSIEGYADAIFYQIEDNQGNLYFSNFAPEGFVIDSVVIESGISYTFQKGDKVNLYVGGDNPIEQLSITASLNGRIFCEPSTTSTKTYLSTSDKYFEIFSPKDATNEESTFFYETSVGGSVSSLLASPDVYSYPEIYDKTLLKDKIKNPVFTKTIDGETEYKFVGEVEPREQEGLPVSIGNGAILYNESDVNFPSSGFSLKTTIFTSFHTNDPAKSPINVYKFDYASFLAPSATPYLLRTVDLGGGDITDYYARVFEAIDSNTFIGLFSCMTIQLTSSENITIDGSPITLTDNQGKTYSNCYILGRNTITGRPNYTACSIGGLSLEDLKGQSDYDKFSGGSFTDGANVYNIQQAFYDTGRGSLASESSFSYAVNYPNNDDKIYAGGIDLGFEILFTGLTAFSYGIPRDNMIPAADGGGNLTGRDLSFEETDINQIGFPKSSKTGIIVYEIIAEHGFPSEDVIFRIIDESDNRVEIGRVSGGEERIISGEIEVDLDSARAKSYRLVTQSTSAFTITTTLKKGSYLYAYFKGEENLQVPNFEGKERWGLSRKPNRRENDDFTQDLLQGKPSVTDSQIDALNLVGKIRYGGRYVENSLINPISSFNSDDSDIVPQESGGITQLVRTNKLDSIGSVLLAICEREVNSIYIGERLITNNDGSTSLAVSDSVIGSIQPLQGSRGCFHRKSISKDQAGNVVFWDDFNKDICRYSREGIVPISDFKVKSFFESLSGEIISFYDKFYDTFFFHHVSSGETISYHSELKWVGFHDMSFTLGGNQLDERSYPISGSSIYKTRGGDGFKYGSYFGSTADSYIQLSKFDQKNFEPRFLRVRGDLVDLSTYSIKSISFVATNDSGQQTTLSEGYFSIDGSYIYSDVYMDENNGGIRDGIPLYASNMKLKITLNNNEDDPHSIREVYLGYVDTTY